MSKRNFISFIHIIHPKKSPMHKGKINGLVVELIERSIEKNFSLIERVNQGQRDYQSILDAATAEYNNSLIQG